MPQDDLLVIHERLGEWGRQLRPRLSHRELRVRETRSSVDLVASLRGRSTAVALIDARDRLADGLEALSSAREACPGLLALVLVDALSPELDHTARELGATHVATATKLRPPDVADLIDRWLDLAGRRRATAGLSATCADVPAEASL